MTRLAEILAAKREEVEAARGALPLAEVGARARDGEPPRGFLKALQAAPGLALVAEVKRASPSQGVIRQAFDPASIARAYAEAGAHCLSVLTDRAFFQGAPEHLAQARAATALPALRKDFIVDPYQVAESRAMGADAVLLIVAALDDPTLHECRATALEWGMDVLVEVHTADELERALALDADLLGVNNRDLATFETSVEVSETLLPLARARAFSLSESALASRRDVERVAAAGARGVLIGTAFCAAPDIGAKVREVMGW